MKRKQICAANWKLNKTPTETRAYFKEFLKTLDKKEEPSLVFFPQNFSLEACADSLSGTQIGFGPQNIYLKNDGAFTGENSLVIAKNIGAQYVLIGHSERRTLFSESDQDTHLKLKLALDSGIKPILCVGETLSEREGGLTEDVLSRQLKVALSSLSKNENLVIAYEPVWAIGTGKVATPDMAQETHAFIRTVICELWGEDFGALIPLLYGGSVKPDNAESLIIQPDVDGFLVGGASLNSSDFLDILRTILRN